MKSILMGTVVAALCSKLASADSGAEAAQELLALERQAWEGWLRGDPDPVLTMSDAGITYFDTLVDKRLDGLPALRELFEKHRGKRFLERYEIIEPKVQVRGDVAVLTYYFVAHSGATASRWNATQVYHRKKEGWRVIHTHWSKSTPPPPAPPQP